MPGGKTRVPTERGNNNQEKLHRVCSVVASFLTITSWSWKAFLLRIQRSMNFGADFRFLPGEKNLAFGGRCAHYRFSGRLDII